MTGAGRFMDRDVSDQKKENKMVNPRKLSKLESIAHWADERWAMACGVNEYITETLDAAGLTVTRTVEQYYADEFGKDSPEYEDHHNDDEFASMSVWTVKGSALIKSIDDGLKRGTLIENKKYEGTFE